jgi:hypothetical protein
MSIDEAFKLIENLDFPEGLKRKFAPGYSLIQITRNGEIVCVERFKEHAEEANWTFSKCQPSVTMECNT